MYLWSVWSETGGGCCSFGGVGGGGGGGGVLPFSQADSKLSPLLHNFLTIGCS